MTPDRRGELRAAARLVGWALAIGLVLGALAGLLLLGLIEADRASRGL